MRAGVKPKPGELSASGFIYWVGEEGLAKHACYMLGRDVGIDCGDVRNNFLVLVFWSG